MRQIMESAFEVIERDYPRREDERGQDAGGGVHAVNVFRAGFGAHQDDRVAVILQALGLVAVEDDLAGGRVDTEVPQLVPV